MTNAGFQVEPSEIAGLRAALQRAAEQVEQVVARAHEAAMREPAMGDGASLEFQRAFGGLLDQRIDELSSYRRRLDSAAARLELTQRAYHRQEAATERGLGHD